MTDGAQFTAVEQQLAAAAQAVHELRTASSRIAELDARHQELSSQFTAAQSLVKDDQHQVHSLEGLTLTHVMAALHGSRDDELAKAQAQAAKAAFQAAELGRQVQAIEAELGAARDRARSLAGAPDQYERALTAKEQLLEQSGGPGARELLSLADERGRLTGELAEITEAQATAHAALSSLGSVQNALSSASGWNTFDEFGGGMIASMEKHSELDQAAALAADADRQLATLRTELTSVGQLAPQLTVGRGTRFVDICFNSIFTDMAFSSHIRQAEQNTDQAIQTVSAVVQQLQEQRSRAEVRLRQIDDRRRHLLAG
jgi:alkylhydroperoxidase/carboxymuconolactone decarboxylase family protein YurZ